MAIFSRRTLQRLLGEAATVLTREQVRKYVRALNNPSDNTLSYEWELAILTAFRALGTVQHEPDLGGRARPDIYFKPNTGSEAIVLDVATVSDKGFEERNSYQAFSKEFVRRISELRKKGIRGGFRVEIGSSSSSLQGAIPPILRLPRPHKFSDVIFNEDFEQFLEAIIRRPGEEHVYSVRTDDADFSAAYDPQSEYVVTSCAQYRVAHSKTRNPIANALRQKARQLKRTGIARPFGIVLCDGDCQLLRAQSDLGPSHGTNAIIRDFLRQHPSIALVLTIRVGQFGVGVGPENLRIETHRYLNDSASLEPALCSAISSMEAALPHPEKDACNANHYLEWLRATGNPHQGSSLWGGLTVTNTSIKISARAIMELLAGRVGQDEFFKQHGFLKTNPFRCQLNKGHLIRSATIEKSSVPEDDDEWLVFEFGGPDPAVSPLTAPGGDTP